MNERATGWVRLQLKAVAYADFGVAPALVPVRLNVLEVMGAPGGQLTAQMMAAEIVAWLEEHPDEYEAYRPLLGELAYSVGTELAMAGDPERAVCWLERSAIARWTDVRAVGNFARSHAQRAVRKGARGLHGRAEDEARRAGDVVLRLRREGEPRRTRNERRAPGDRRPELRATRPPSLAAVRQFADHPSAPRSRGTRRATSAPRCVCGVLAGLLLIPSVARAEEAAEPPVVAKFTEKTFSNEKYKAAIVGKVSFRKGKKPRR